MSKFKLIRCYVCMLLSLVGVSVYAQDNVIDEVVWVVGDEAILKSDVENERLTAQYENRHFDGDPYCVIPEELAVQKLFLHQAELDSIYASDQDVIQKVEQQIAWLTEQIGSREKMEEYYNKTYTQIREMLRENIRDGMRVQQMQQEIVGDIKLTPAEVRNYFNKLPQDSIPFVPTQVEVQIITQEPKISEKEIDIPNLQFGTSDNLEDLKNDKYLLKRLSHLDWNEVLRPATSQIQYRLWKENHS